MNSLLLVCATIAAFTAVSLLLLWFWNELVPLPWCHFTEKSLRKTRHSELTGAAHPHVPEPGSTPSPSSQAVSLLQAGCPCSELLLRTYAPALGLSRGEAFEIGMKLAPLINMTDTCGAVTGAFILLGKHWSSRGPDNGESERRLAAGIREFRDRFEGLHGTITCRKVLLSAARKTPRGPLTEERPILPGLCPGLVRDASELLEQLLDGTPERSSMVQAAA